MTHKILITEGLKMAVQLIMSFHWEVFLGLRRNKPLTYLEAGWEGEERRRGSSQRSSEIVFSNLPYNFISFYFKSLFVFPPIMYMMYYSFSHTYMLTVPPEAHNRGVIHEKSSELEVK